MQYETGFKIDSQEVVLKLNSKLWPKTQFLAKSLCVLLTPFFILTRHNEYADLKCCPASTA